MKNKDDQFYEFFDRSKQNSKDSQLFLSELRDEKKSLKEYKDSSNKRADLLLNSICGGGILLIFQTIKEIGVESLSNIELGILFSAAMFFIFAVLINYWTHNIKVKIIENQEIYINKCILHIKYPDVKDFQITDEDIDNLKNTLNTQSKLNSFLIDVTIIMSGTAVMFIIMFFAFYITSVN